MMKIFLLIIIFVLNTFFGSADTTAIQSLDFAKATHTFNGIGGLSGGGATSVLLTNKYPEKQKDEILDFLFKPKFGASLQIVKVEIGGDSQSTDGTETSHMHSPDDLNYERGYEWEILVEAKKRNPNIKTYGLAWAYPGWVGGPEQNPSPFSHPDLTANYILKWLQGALDVYNIRIDYIGIWNERDSNGTYVKFLRETLDKNGFRSTKIVAKDGYRDICDEVKLDKGYEEAVDIIGLHYPSDYDNYTSCHSLNKPIWASEESSSYDDLNGAACWARIITSHFAINEMTSSIMWNLVGSYYHGTNWYASSLLTAVQPWSGYYETDMPVVWATAHVTQFTEVGWKYLDVGSGSGELPNGGYYTSLISPSMDEFTLIIVKISRDHAPCTRPPLPDFDVSSEEVTFQMKNINNSGKIQSLNVWYSNFEKNVKQPAVFNRKNTIAVNTDGTFKLQINVGDVFTLSTVGDARKGTFPSSSHPKSIPQFPLPYNDDFQSYKENGEAKFLADQIGAFEIHPASLATSSQKWSMKQMVPELPIGWSDHGSNGPMTLIGMLEWQDVTVETTFYLPTSANQNTSGCVATRIDQMWQQGIVYCLDASGKWTLTQGGPKLGGAFDEKNIIQQGSVKAIGLNSWHTISLTTNNDTASGTLDDFEVFANIYIRNIDNGFAAIGSNQWHPIEFGSLQLSKVGSRWSASKYGDKSEYKVGDAINAADCPTNGIATASTSFLLRPDWLLEHIASGLCMEASSKGNGATFTLQKCIAGNVLQELRNDYTNIRNNLRPVTLGAYKKVDKVLTLTGELLHGKVSLCSGASCIAPSSWSHWAYFPNTNQLRNQYVTIPKLGYPKCLSVV